MRFLPGVVAGVLWLAAAAPAVAQLYPVEVRPPGLSYRVARTSHFDLIYPDGYDREAAEAGAVMEKSLARARELTGTRRSLRVPVILDAYNDRSNGFVSPFPFRMDLEIPALRGNGLSPRHPSWLNTVGRHELVHAVHAEYGSGFGVIGLMRLLSPDMARSMNLAVPAGIAEGVAVHLESEGEHRPGRMNHPFFEMEFRAAIASERPWSLAQMLERPQYSLPGDRYYHGGSYLYDYLYRQDGGSAFRRAQQFQYVMPFLGYGVNLWYGSRKPPWVVGREFRLEMSQRELERQVRQGQVTVARVVASGRGRVHRRPQWTSDTEIVAYGSGYYDRPGFYRFDAQTGESSRISAERITEDAFFSLSSDRRHATFSRYHVDPVVPGRRIAEVHRLDVETGEETRLTDNGHAFSAVTAKAGNVFAVINSGQYSRLASIRDGLEFPAVPLWSRTTIKTLAASPVDGTLAALVNRDGYQGVVVIESSPRGYRVEPLLLSRDCSILDFSWSPDGRQILFAADEADVPNLFIYDFESRLVNRITNARYGAFEGSVSPDGSRVVFVDYQHESWRIVVADLGDLLGSAVATEAFADTQLFENPPVAASLVPDSLPSLPSEPYRAIRYLAPRGVLPLFDYDLTPTNTGDVDLGFGFGAAVAGSDPLQRWSYIAGAYYQADDVWGRFSLQSGRSVLRPAVSVFRLPSTRLALTQDGVRRLGWEEQGVQVSSVLPVVLASNIYSSSLALSLGGEVSRARFFDSGGNALTSFSRRASLVPTVVASVGTHATRRDLRASTGVTLGVTSTIDVWSDSRRRRAVLADLRIFSRTIPGTGGSVSLIGGVLWQNRASVYNLDYFLPRGLEDTFLDDGAFLRFGADLIQPLLYPDDGFMILPVFVKSIYAYGFAESVKSISSFRFDIDSVGGGLGVQLRFLHSLSFDLRFGMAYLPDEGTFEAVFR